MFCRSMSQPADVNMQSSVGMFHFYDVLHCSVCEFRTKLLYLVGFNIRMPNRYAVLVSLQCTMAVPAAA